MAIKQWCLQDARARFSQLVEAALQGVPQHVTRCGRAAVVVLSEASYQTLLENAQKIRPGFIAHLLAVPKDEASPENTSVALRDAGAAFSLDSDTMVPICRASRPRSATD